MATLEGYGIIPLEGGLTGTTGEKGFAMADTQESNRNNASTSAQFLSLLNCLNWSLGCEECRFDPSFSLRGSTQIKEPLDALEKSLLFNVGFFPLN